MKGLVEPIKDIAELEKLINYLKKDIRYYTLFLIGLYSGLRISDICGLNISDVKDKDFIELKEQKTGKYKRFPLNDIVKTALVEYLPIREETWGIGEAEDALFIGKKHCRLDRAQVYREIVKAAKDIGIKENIGTHTMRKTFGYHHYRQFKDIALLQTLFNHSSPEITKRYIGITQEELDNSYLSLQLSKDIKVEAPKRETKNYSYINIENGLEYLLNMYRKLDKKVSALKPQKNGTITFLENYLKSGNTAHRVFAETALSYSEE